MKKKYGKQKNLRVCMALLALCSLGGGYVSAVNSISIETDGVKHVTAQDYDNTAAEGNQIYSSETGYNVVTGMKNEVGTQTSPAGSSMVYGWTNTLTAGGNVFGSGNTLTSSGYVFGDTNYVGSATSTVIGSYNKVAHDGEKALTDGKTGYEYNVALGYGNTIGSASNAIVIGSGSSVTAEKGIAIGHYANASAEMAVAIGYNAVASTAPQMVVSASDTTTETWMTTVSFGNQAAGTGGSAKTYLARLKNIYEGEDDYDAVNVKQLKSYVEENSGKIYTGTDPITVDNENNTISIRNMSMGADATGSSAEAKTNAASIALGQSATASGYKSLAFGYNSQATKTSATAYGESAQATGIASVALGSTAQATKDDTVAVGKSAKATNNKAAALGRESEASGVSSVAVGYQAKANNYGAIAIGHQVNQNTTAGYYSVAIGWTSKAAGQDAVAIGDSSKATAEESVVIGHSAEATSTAINSVAIGRKSKATEANTVSVGSGDSSQAYGFRRIVNVADGTKNTDAATYGQLVNAKADNSATPVTYTAYTPDDDGIVTVETNNGGTAFKLDLSSFATGDNLIIGDDTNHWLDVSWNGDASSTDVTRGANSAAYGYLANASGDYATATGYRATAKGQSSIALGSGYYSDMTMTLRSGATAYGTNSIALGITSQTGYTTMDQTVFGGTSAVAIGDTAQAYGDKSIAFGYKSETGYVDEGIGMTYGNSSVSIGDFAKTYGNSSVALGKNAYTKYDNSVAVGAESVVTASNTVSFGHKKDDFAGYYLESSTGNTSRTEVNGYDAVNYDSDSFARLTNVADGTDNHDAAVFGQLVDAQVVSGDSSTYTAYTPENGIVTVKTNNGGTAFTLDLSSLSDSYTFVSGNEDALTVTTSDDGTNTVTITAVTGDISDSSNALVTGSTVYDALHGTTLDLGYLNTVDNTYNTALGFMNTAEGYLSTAVGSINTASKDAASAFGYGNEATGSSSVAVGFYNTASGLGSDALGVYNEATGERSSAVGVYNTATADYSSAMGYGSVATGEKSTAMGYDAYAGAEGATAIGYEASAKESGTVSFGHKDGDFAGYYVDDDGNSSNVAKDGYTAVNYDGDSFARLTNVADGEDNHDAATFGQIAAEDQSITLKDGENVIKANDGTTEIAEFTGMEKVAANDYGFVSGADLYAEGRENASGTIISSKNDVGTNLSLLDEQVTDLKDLSNITNAGKSVVKTLSQEAVVVESGKNIKVTANSDKDGNIVYTVSTDLGNSGEMSKKADTDAGNVGKNLQGTDGASGPTVKEIEANLDAWGTAIGTGKVAEDSGQLVTGATVYKETRANVSGTYVSKDKDVGTNLSALDKYVAANVKDVAGLKNLSNLTAAGENVIKNRAQEAVVVAAGDNVKVDPTTDKDGNITYTVTADLENAAAMKKKANADASNVGKNLKASDGTSAAAAKDIEENLAAWGTALGTGEIEETSNELVTGATVYAETRANVSGTHISADSDVGTNLTALDTEIVKNAGDISGLKDMSNLTQTGVAAVKTLSKEAVIVAAGTNVKVDPTTDKDGNITYTVSTDLSKSKELLQKANTDASNVGKNLKAADGTSAASATDVQNNLAAWGAALGTGSITSDSTQLVTGATVYKETRANVSGTHISADSDVGTNLSSLDKEIVQNASDIATNAANIQKNKDDIAALDTKITENTDKISQVESKVNANTDSINSVQKQVDANTGKITDLESKVDTNTNNISKLGDRVTETENQISAIDDRVSAQEKLVSYDADAGQIKIGGDKSIKADTVTVAGVAGDRTLTGLKDGENKNDAATVGQMNTAIDKKIAENAYTVESGNTDTLKVEKDEANKTWTVTAQTGDVSADNNGLVTGAKVYEAVENSKADGGTYTIDSDNRTATVMNKDGSTAFVLTVDESIAAKYKAGDNVSISDDNTISVTATGKVASGDTGIVTGGAVYEKTGDTSKLTEAGLGDNLTDSVLAVNDRVLTVNDRMNSLSDDIHKVGAGAAALAALRPEAFTPGDKLSFAVGFGHYKNANAGAFGAFYKPNTDTTVSVGSTIGNGDPMVNMGVSFKIGARSKGAGIYSSNAELIRELNTLRAGDEKQKQVINVQAKRIIRLEKENAEIKADNAQMKVQIAQIMKKLSMSDTVRKTAVIR